MSLSYYGYGLIDLSRVWKRTFENFQNMILSKMIWFESCLQGDIGWLIDVSRVLKRSFENIKNISKYEMFCFLNFFLLLALFMFYVLIWKSIKMDKN